MDRIADSGSADGGSNPSGHTSPGHNPGLFYASIVSKSLFHYLGSGGSFVLQFLNLA